MAKRPDIYGLKEEPGAPATTPLLPPGILPISYGAPAPARFGAAPPVKKTPITTSSLGINTFGNQPSAAAAIDWQSNRADLLAKMKEREDRAERYGLEGEAAPGGIGFAKEQGPLPFAGVTPTAGPSFDAQEQRNADLRRSFGMGGSSESSHYGLAGEGYSLAAPSGAGPEEQRKQQEQQSEGLRKLFLGAIDQQQKQADATDKAKKATDELAEKEKREKEQKEALTKAIREEIDLEQKRIDTFARATRGMREILEAGDHVGQSFRTLGGIFSSLVRGNVMGALEGGVGLMRQGTGALFRRRDRAARDANEGLEERRRSLSREDFAAASPKRGLPMANAVPSAKADAGGAGALPPLPAAASADSGGNGGGGVIGGILGAAGGALTGLAAGATAVAGAAVAGAAAIGQVTQSMISMASRASPAAFERFQLAVDDSQAVLGRVFVPVLELATEGVRTIGDVLAEILPSTKEMREAFAPIKDAFAQLKDSIAPLLPYLKAAVSGFIAVGIKIVEFTTRGLVNLAKLFGLYEEGSSKAFSGKSFGASAQPARFMDMRSFLRQSYEKAASMGSEKENYLTHLTTLPAILKTIDEWFNAWKNLGVDVSKKNEAGYHEFAGMRGATGGRQNDVYGEWELIKNWWSSKK